MSVDPKWLGVAEGVLALVCGYASPLRERHLLVVLNGYIDDSYDDDVFVLAGFVAPAEEWAEFSQEWQAILEMSPRLRRLKMSEALRLRGEFHGWRSEDRDARLKLLFNVIDRHVSFHISCSINMKAFRKVFAPDDFFKNGASQPFYHAFAEITVGLANYQNQIGMPERVDFIFDNQEMEKSKIYTIWDMLKRNGPPEITRMMGAVPVFQDDERVLPLQAADLEAGWLRTHRKAEAKGLPTPVFEWRSGEWREGGGMPAVVAFLDEDALRLKREVMAGAESL